MAQSGEASTGRFSSLITISPSGGQKNNGDHTEKTQLLTSKKSSGNTFSRLFTKAEEYEIFRSEEFDSSNGRTLGTFTGVFAPVSLGIFSSLLFLRMGYILGNTGLLVALLQFFIAYVILISTIASISALSTNGAVQGGGVYYMLSRTLGPEFGGAIGTLFTLPIYFKFLARGPWIEFLYNSSINLLSLLICLVGTRFFGKTSVLIFFMVMCCILITSVSFFLNITETEDFVFNATDPLKCVQPPKNSTNQSPNCTLSTQGSFTGIGAWNETLIIQNFYDNLYPKYEYDCSESDKSLNFFVIFGVLFSGVTGIMSGANMSGELRSPSKSIPRGTISSCLFTLLVIPSLLQHNCMYMSLISMLPVSVTVGVLMATFSASLNNLIGASRILEAVAKDVVFGPLFNFIVKGTHKDNPVVAVICTWFVVELFLMMGSLNKIAQLCSVLFLLSYGTINLTCLFLHLASAPNFRPTFKYFSTYTCLIGLLGSAIMMFAVSAIYSAVGILLCLSLILLLNLFSPIRHTNWGSISQALIFHQSHVKFWRPQMLLLVSNPRTNCSLIEFVNALKKSGLYVLGHVQVDELSEHEKDLLWTEGIVEVTITKSLREGISQLVRISGIGAMKPNTVILGFKDETFPRDDFQNPSSPFATNKFDESQSVSAGEYIGIISDILKQNKNLCLCRHFQKLNTSDMFRPKKESIFGTTVKAKMYLDATDITDSTSLFLLQLACIVNMVNRWNRLKIRVFIAQMDLAELLEMLRIEASIKVLSWENPSQLQVNPSPQDDLNTFQEHLSICRNTVRERSDQTAVTFLYMPEIPADTQSYERFHENLKDLTDQWPPTLMARGLAPVTSTTLE
ncbi:solute carrier family 12 member 9 [Caligus rogercresseyi]|uniref:Solute carrier family 12 member 9 n=1 Tax=Caligus rogercresseyi TaxID=217165 RepID=A0A7T8KAB8_CALRO|nr:solute carrier family 12 member 9 [Caligus rogercresseyi]